MKEISVNLEENSFKIYVSSGFDGLSEKLDNCRFGNKAMIVTDSNVDKLYSEEFVEMLTKAGFETSKLVIPAGEDSKNLDTVNDIYRVCMKKRFERTDTIYALGGGVVGDTAGFAASTYLRGINLVQVPTTVIAQCDSSIGGKTGVDFEGGKNLVGAFYHPVLVYSNIDVLQTLPEREYVSGLAEVVKHAVIKDAGLFEYLECHADEIMAKNKGILEHIVETNSKIKARVVELDEKESSLRVILNFGHTIGHAVESVLKFSLLHGECVALGMSAACHIACEAGLFDKKEYDRLTELLKKFRLPVTYSHLDADKVYNQIMYDKKITDGKIKFILPKRIGEVAYVDDICKESILKAINVLK